MAHDETASTSKWTMEAKSFLEVHPRLLVSNTSDKRKHPTPDSRPPHRLRLFVGVSRRFELRRQTERKINQTLDTTQRFHT